MTPAGQAEPLLDHLFRHQSGRIVAHLTRVLGPGRIDLAEEAVQDAMLRALQTWPYRGMPENPAAWLFRVAHNIAIDGVRRNRWSDEDPVAVLDALARGASASPEDAVPDERLRDDELRLIFLCCHPGISRDSRVALSLKTAGGFSIGEIARAFLSDETAVAQRLVRAKRQIRESRVSLDMQSGAQLAERLDSVLDVIYFMFNEGYAAHQGEELIRTDLCHEALRLSRLVAESSISEPRVHALTAVLALQAARLPARVDAAGDLVVLFEQDRGRWDRTLINLGFAHFERSISGAEISEYHVQAALAATHARATAARPANWPLILTLYDQLLALNSSPVIALNRAVAVSRVHGAAAALGLIEPLEREVKLRDYHLLLAVKGHLLLELGQRAEAAQCFRQAIACSCSEPERRFLLRKAEECR